MSDIFPAVVAGGVGVLLGAFYFGGLWWTVRKGVVSAHPALWFIGSMLLRISVVLFGFYLVARDHWVRMLVCLFGFVISRALVTWLTRPAKTSPLHPQQEASCAS